MSKISKSSERFTFQRDNYIARIEQEGGNLDDPDVVSMIKFYNSWAEQAKEQEDNPAWQKHNMEYDLRTCEWMLEKVRGDQVYAQHLYAAMCNNEFTKREMWPILKDERWSCSWRHAGGIIADMREEGDYIDWYCSGIRNDGYLDDQDDGQELTIEQEIIRKKVAAYVPESVVTDEISDDLFKIGWLVADLKDDE
jgi:hypothetical protein